MAVNDRPAGCLVRLIWMALGNAALVLIGLHLVQSAPASVWFDVAYWLVVALIIAARFADIRYYAGTDSLGAPATLDDWRRYSFQLVALAGSGWLIAHALVAFSR
ncbi:MAG: hypothetical protein U0795_04155 [Pirellulales bacterium]